MVTTARQLVFRYSPPPRVGRERTAAPTVGPTTADCPQARILETGIPIMYQHLLVPVDGTDLSVDVVGNAVALANSVGARVTFLHALPDHASSLRGDVEVLRVSSLDDYAYEVSGKARELLSKAEAAARAFGVPCTSLTVVSDHPAQAIVRAAREHECDLIVMASHGGRNRLGMALASETMKVLVSAGRPVLVTATGDPTEPAHAIGIIRDEHRSLAAVMHAWMHALEIARPDGTAPDIRLMRAMLRYLHNFPLAVHHPKEEAVLFARLRERTPSVDAELDELQRQHVRDIELVDQLKLRVDAIEDAAAGEAAAKALRELDAAVKAYASFLWDHMGREETVILPAAQRHLTAQDWALVDAAFAQNRDPDFGGEAEREYRHLFSRIVNAANDWH
jgi:nucleotide-binding universal stress UspA family protein/hemerythrin-like domain-containing protein